MKNKETHKRPTERIGFVPAEKFYEILQDLIFDMVECTKNRDVFGVIVGFREVYAITFYFINKYMTPEDKDIKDLRDIRNKLSLIKGDSTDFESNKSNAIVMDCLEEIQERKIKLYVLMAKAGLFVPMNKMKDHLPSALSTDDFYPE